MIADRAPLAKAATTGPVPKDIDRLLGAGEALAAPWPLRLTSWFAPLRLIPAWLVGKGVRPEHVHSPESAAPAPLG